MELIDGLSMVRRDGAANLRDWFRRLGGRGRLRFVDIVAGVPVVAFTEPDYHGLRLLGGCECGGAEYVCRAEPVFYCLSCGNAANSGRLRPVLFEEDLERMGDEG